MDGEEKEVVEDFSFLGVLAECEGSCEKRYEGGSRLVKWQCKVLKDMEVQTSESADNNKNSKRNDLSGDTL